MMDPDILFHARAWHLSVAPGTATGAETVTGIMKPAETPVRNVVLATGTSAESGALAGA